MPHGTCDPSPNPHHTTEHVKDNGRVSFVVHWSWDGVSVPPNCNGPIIDVRVRNTGPNTYVVSLPNSLTSKTIELPPDTDRVFSGQKLEGIGVTTAAHIVGVTVTPV